MLSALPGGPAVHWPLGCLLSCDPETASGRENIQHQLTGHQLTNNDKQWGTHNTDNNTRLRKAGMIWSGNSVFFEKAKLQPAINSSEAIYQNILRLFCKDRILLGPALACGGNTGELRERGQVVSDRERERDQVWAGQCSNGQHRQPPEPFCQLSAFK